MLVFKSSKNYITVGLLWLIVILLLVVPFTAPTNEDTGIFDLIGFTILYVITGMLIWILLDTRYKIIEKKLFYASGPIRGSIKTERIRKVERWNKWYVMSFIKPALDKDGLIIYYDKFEDIFISPENKEEFIKALCEMNPGIEVV